MTRDPGKALPANLGGMDLAAERDRVLRMAEGLLHQLERMERGPRIPRSRLPRCGARTRAGHPCRAPGYRRPADSAPRNGRCRMHGGLSTGPRTAEGKTRCRAAALRNLEKARRSLEGGP